MTETTTLEITVEITYYADIEYDDEVGLNVAEYMKKHRKLWKTALQEGKVTYRNAMVKL